MAVPQKLSVNNSRNKNTFGKDILYICQNPNCGHEEKEFALVSRNHKLCTECGSVSIKSYLVETYNWVTSTIQAPTEYGE